NKSLCMICFKGVYLNDIHPVYKINLGELIVLEIKKKLRNYFTHELVLRGFILEESELKIFLDLFCFNSVKYMMCTFCNNLEEMGISCNSLVENENYCYNHKNYCYKTNECYFNQIVCGIQQLREELLSSQYKSFFLVYQPKLDVKTEKVHSVEVLTRWQHQDYGVISPIDFLKIIKQMGNQYEFDLFIIKKSCKEIKDLLGYIDNFSVNVSISTLNQVNFSNAIENILEEAGIRPTYLTVEILEDENISDYKNVALNLNNLIQKGIRISLDDFGSGYSSYYRLLELNVSELKIPKEFFQENFEFTSKNEKILFGIINMCKEMGIQTVAEGIESISDAQYVKKLGVDYIQGYYYSKPLKKESFINYLTNQS
ncbi:EAL domain-containing protein, partial [Turicibacter sanguinis]|nr:EAL domain-containing protein [Turicibacter sanguinis]